MGLQLGRRMEVDWFGEVDGWMVRSWEGGREGGREGGGPGGEWEFVLECLPARDPVWRCGWAWVVGS